MKAFWARFSERMKRFGLAVGKIMSTIFLVVFYFTIFAVFALPFRLLTDVLRWKVEGSNFVSVKKQLSSLDDFRLES